jgi:small subunit ribosomal protein S7
MSRRRKAQKRELIPDPRYSDIIVSKFSNSLMQHGRKSISEKLLYGALEKINEKTGQEALKVFKEAIENVKPQIETRSRRVGGATYQVPTEVRPERRQALAIRWIIGAARGRSESTMLERLANELLDASQNRGVAIKKREDTLKMAEANRAFAHYRW